MGKNRGQKWESAILNHDTYMMYYNRLKDYALSMYEWEGLPPEINERFLEMTMFEQGKVIFFKEPTIGFMAMPVMSNGSVNHYQEPTGWKAVSFDFQRDLTPEESVVIWANLSRVAMEPIIQAFAMRLYQVERTMDVNINAQKTPVLILCDENQRMTMENLYMQFDGNHHFIFGNKGGFDKEAVQVLKTDAPFVSDKLMAYKHAIWNEAMTFLGVGNAKQDKKERLVSAEVDANDEQITGSRYVWLEARQMACEQINKMFGLNVSVRFKFDADAEREEEKQQLLLSQSEDDKNGDE